MAPKDEDGLKQAAEDTAEREDEEAGWLEMLVDADKNAPRTAAIASQDRAVALELEMEAAANSLALPIGPIPGGWPGPAGGARASTHGR